MSLENPSLGEQAAIVIDLVQYASNGITYLESPTLRTNSDNGCPWAECHDQHTRKFEKGQVLIVEWRSWPMNQPGDTDCVWQPVLEEE